MAYFSRMQCLALAYTFCFGWADAVTLIKDKGFACMMTGNLILCGISIGCSIAPTSFRGHAATVWAGKCPAHLNRFHIYVVMICAFFVGNLCSGIFGERCLGSRTMGSILCTVWITTHYLHVYEILSYGSGYTLMSLAFCFGMIQHYLQVRIKGPFKAPLLPFPSFHSARICNMAENSVGYLVRGSEENFDSAGFCLLGLLSAFGGVALGAALCNYPYSNQSVALAFGILIWVTDDIVKLSSATLESETPQVKMGSEEPVASKTSDASSCMTPLASSSSPSQPTYGGVAEKV
eukprot:TRINITY_DN40852_c0_g1_i1.p1 TRINITY_DN40852_c0_g1~~TRINITY_DN40852_c0_g1_i1.p1  ORF type:complete len:292 (-),score=16.12 TRINITY_DN40852_c0_g1_i1:202-1077(-)